MKLTRREWLLLGATGVAAAAAGWVAGPLLTQSRSGVDELLRARFTDLAGRARTLSEWAQATLVCNFWATWCPPCIDEIPLLMEARRTVPGGSAEIIGIAIDGREKVADFVTTHRLDYPVLISESGGIELLRRLGNDIGGLPFTVALDSQRRLVRKKLGAFRTAVEIEAFLRDAG